MGLEGLQTGGTHEDRSPQPSFATDRERLASDRDRLASLRNDLAKRGTFSNRISGPTVDDEPLLQVGAVTPAFRETRETQESSM